MKEFRRNSVYKFKFGLLWNNLKKEIIKERGNICSQCGNHNFNLILDHIIPVSMGGNEFEKNNLQLLCIDCHNIKTKQDQINFHILKKLGFIEGFGKQIWWFYDMDEVKKSKFFPKGNKSKEQLIKENKGLIDLFLKINFGVL